MHFPHPEEGGGKWRLNCCRNCRRACITTPSWVRDHEVNRRFFEDVLGIPLVATWCEKNFSTEMQKEIEFCHTFFGMEDGSALAFFQFADPEMYELTRAEKPPKIGRH